MGSGLPTDRILEFWFGPHPLLARRKFWWRGGSEVDRQIRENFEAALNAALEPGGLDEPATPRDQMAAIIVLDQFTRNVFRGTARAFAGDVLAQHHARQLVDAGSDRDFHPLERAFLYMPFEHAESRVLQQVSVALFTALADDAPAALEEELRDNLRHAHTHRDIVARFGRFPHRNQALGRPSTAEELAWLADGAPRFGQ